jgi:hypothetical protein
VELDVLVGDVGLEVEGRVDDLDLGDILILVLKFEGLADVNNNTKYVNLVSLVIVLSGVCLNVRRGLTRVISLLSSVSSFLDAIFFSVI